MLLLVVSNRYPIVVVVTQTKVGVSLIYGETEEIPTCVGMTNKKTGTCVSVFVLAHFCLFRNKNMI